MDLNETLYSEILKLSEEGNAFSDNGKYQIAKEKFILALNLVPNPKKDWEAATWLYAALGDVSFILQAYQEAVDYLFDALNCPDGMANSFIMLRLGESLFELNSDINKCKEYLLKAFMLGGIELFEGENQKYFELIKDIV